MQILIVFPALGEKRILLALLAQAQLASYVALFSGAAAMSLLAIWA